MLMPILSSNNAPSSSSDVTIGKLIEKSKYMSMLLLEIISTTMPMGTTLEIIAQALSSTKLC